jgi:COP9 signalosome complex subunit 3
VYYARVQVNNTLAFLTYYYYGGMVYAAVGEYARALHFFDICLSVPASAVSQVMVDAYKKHLLVSLVHDGSVRAPSASRSPILHRAVRNQCVAYTQLVDAVVKHPYCVASVRSAVVDKHSATYEQVGASVFVQCKSDGMQDGNKSLVERVFTSITERTIERVCQVCCTNCNVVTRSRHSLLYPLLICARVSTPSILNDC